MTSTVYRFGVRFEGDAASLARSAKQAEAALRTVGTRGMQELRRMGDARKVLGVRSERDVQREIQRTQAAYNRLTRSGTLSWNEQLAAGQKMRAEVTRLTNEMGRLTEQQKRMQQLRRMEAPRKVLGVRSERDVQREIQLTQAAYNRLARSGTLSWNEQLAAGQKMRAEVTRLTNEMGRLTEQQKRMQQLRRMDAPRELLGVRSQRDLQREIQRTQAAYNRLARSGQLSWGEQRVAARRMREEVTRLSNEMGRLTGRQKLALGLKGSLALGGAAIGAAAVLKPKLDRAMSYQDRLRDVANVASDVGASRAERQREFDSAQRAVADANRYGGGNRDDALDAYNQMVSKGSTFTGDLPRQLLPEIMKAATASAAAATDMASIAAAGIQNFGMKPSAKDAKEWFNIAAIGGKLGGFEVRQQAAYLPEQMALAGNIGMRGKTDFANLVMLNQAAEKTAGTPDKAATNVKQFLTDVGSNFFRLRAHKATGVNFAKYATENRLKGVGMIDSAMQLVDAAVQKHPAYRQLQGRLATTTDPEQRATIESAMKIIQGSVSSQFFHNQESAQVVAAYRLHKEFMKTGQQQALSGADELGASFDFKEQGASYQANKLAIESANSMQQMMDRLTPAFGTLSSGVADTMKQYPGYTAAIIAAASALGLLATSAGALTLLGGGALLKKLVPGGVPAAAALPPGAATGAGRLGGLGYASRVLGKVGLLGAMSGLFFTSPEEMEILNNADRMREGYRGKDFKDPRVLGASTVQERVGSATGPLPLLQQDLKGEILVRVTGAPGLNVEAETRSMSPRIPFRTDAGRTNLNAGF